MMKKLWMAALLMALTSAGLFAADGQVLINNSTVIASGGYPYVISQSGSYKLSGNLTAPVNAFAILVAANNVTLDLNGFTVQCSVQLANSVACIGQAITGVNFHDIAVRNGVVVANLVAGGTGSSYFLSAVYFGNPSVRITIEDLKIESNDDTNNFGAALSLGANSIVKGNTVWASTGHAVNILCPSVIVENVNTGLASNAGSLGCVVANNYRIN